MPMFFLKKKYVPELISLHIPKTAGTSFRHILKEVYGERAVVRFDIRRGVVELNSEVYESEKLPSAKVLHGHFIYDEIQTKFDLPQNIKKITWLRHPVHRVISNYYYLESRLKTILNEEDRGVNILKKMQRTLSEYAKDERNRNRQSKFLSGISLNKFDYVGITENFEHDLIEMAKILDWPKIPQTTQKNITPSKKSGITDEIFQEIAELNEDDMKLYSEALSFKNISSF